MSTQVEDYQCPKISTSWLLLVQWCGGLIVLHLRNLVGPQPLHQELTTRPSYFFSQVQSLTPRALILAQSPGNFQVPRIRRSAVQHRLRFRYLVKKFKWDFVWWVFFRIFQRHYSQNRYDYPYNPHHDAMNGHDDDNCGHFYLLFNLKFP